MANVVLVVDMVRGFLEEGNPLYCGAKAREIIPNVKKRLEEEAKKGSKIIYLCDTHEPQDAEFKMFPPHCIKGTSECEVIPELASVPGEVMPKTRYSGFYGTDLAGRLAELKPDKVIVVGVCTDICVQHTVSDARNRDYSVEVPASGVASFDEKAHQTALEHMEKILGAKVTGETRTIPERHPNFVPSEKVLSGETADIYFARTMEILKKENINPVVAADVFCARAGIFCGIEEVKSILSSVLPKGNSEVWALGEGATMSEKEVCVRIKAPYQSFGLYETAILGVMANSSAWATAAHECVVAAGGIPVVSFGARHVHPGVAGVMDYAAVVGGCAGCSSIEGAGLAGIKPSGTMPHAFILIMGDTVKAALAFDRDMPPDVPRITLVDTFKDEVEESLRVARALGDKLTMVRLDTPTERGRVTSDLVKEVRAWLDLKGYKKVGIFVTGGLTPERIADFVKSGAKVSGFGVGHYISGAEPNDFKLDIHEINGKPVAKRGRLPGPAPSTRLERII